MTAPTVGALFAGYGGLELAIAEVFPGATTAWYSEIDPGPTAILAHRYPGVPNVGDVTAVDWHAVAPVDIIAGGSPCQDLSHAGKRQGMREGTRSGLWASMVEAIDVLRPSLVVWENVRGALSAEGEPPTEAVLEAEARLRNLSNAQITIARRRARAIREGQTEHARYHARDAVRIARSLKRQVEATRRERARLVRAIGRVVGDLAELGYDAAWCGLPASAVGACHGRWRIFVLAWPAGLEVAQGPGGGGRAGRAAADADDGRREVDAAVGRAEGESGARFLPGRPAAAAADARGETLRRGAGLREGESAGVGGRRSDDGAVPGRDGSAAPVTLMPTPTAWEQRGDHRTDPRNLLPLAVLRMVDEATLAEGDVTLLPTPAVNDMGEGKTLEWWDEWAPRQKSSTGAAAPHGKSLAIETARLLPTPTTEPTTGNGHARDLGGEVRSLLPTPSAADGLGGHETRGGDRSDELLLGGVVKAMADPGRLMPTPQAHDAKGPKTPAQVAARRTTSGGLPRNLNETVANELGEGRLMPTPTTLDHIEKRTTHAGGNLTLQGAVGGVSEVDTERHQAAGRLMPTPRATDGSKGGPNQRGSSGDLMLPSAVVAMLPTPTAHDARGTGPSQANRKSPGLDAITHLVPEATPRLMPTPTATDAAASGSGHNANGVPNVTLTDATVRGVVAFGEYAAAIARHERAIGRQAPPPTEMTGRADAARLSPRFVEWMMCLPDGWVTDPAIWSGWKPTAARNAQLKALGNGVVPRQAAAGLRYLISAVFTERAPA